MTKDEKLVAYIETVEDANTSFYTWEESEYPDGGSPYADMHKDVYVAGYVAHWRESLDEIERT